MDIIKFILKMMEDYQSHDGNKGYYGAKVSGALKILRSTDKYIHGLINN